MIKKYINRELEPKSVQVVKRVNRARNVNTFSSTDTINAFGFWWYFRMKKTGYNYGEMDEIYKELNERDLNKDVD